MEQTTEKSVTRRKFFKGTGYAAASLLAASTAGTLYYMDKNVWDAPTQPPAGGITYKDVDTGAEYIDNTAQGMMSRPANPSADGEDYYFAPLPDPAQEAPYAGTMSTYDPYTELTGLGMSTEDLPAGAWIMPAIKNVHGAPTRSTFTDGRFSNGIPDSHPGNLAQGIRSTLSVPISATEGSSVIAGHVNLRSTGHLSDWGYLHQAAGGMKMVLKTYENTLETYRVRRVYLRRQGDEFENDQQLWAQTGPKVVSLVTCAGAYIGADGATGDTRLFPYTHNIIVECEKV